jgi:hypothetical protein
MKLQVASDDKPQAQVDNQRLEELDDCLEERITDIKVGVTRISVTAFLTNCTNT